MPIWPTPSKPRNAWERLTKTDPIDARGLALLLRNRTLPEVWIPPGEIRDRRELLRTRMALRDMRTFLKHNPAAKGGFFMPFRMPLGNLLILRGTLCSARYRG